MNRKVQMDKKDSMMDYLDLYRAPIQCDQKLKLKVAQIIPKVSKK